jgi:WD40 repeat protein
VRYLSHDFEGAGRLTFAPSGRWLYQLLDGRLLGWDLLDAGDRPAWMVGGVHGYHLTVSRCGRWLVVVNHGSMMAFDRTANRPHRLWPESTHRIVGDAMFSPDGGELLAVESGHAEGDGRLHCWRVGNWDELPPPPGVACTSVGARRIVFTGRLAVSADGTRLATEHAIEEGDEFGHGLSVWDSGTGERLADKRTRKSTIGRLLFTADGMGLLSDQFRWVARYDVRTLSVTAEFATPVDSHLDELAVCPDGQLVAVGMGEQVVLLDAISLRQIAAYDFGLGPMVRVAFAPDGQTTAACGNTGRVVVFDLD